MSLREAEREDRMAGSADDIETFLERRRAARAPLVVRVEYATVDALFSEFTRNINEGGMFIATDQPPDLDSSVTMQFTLPGGDEPIKVGGRVTRVSDGEDGEPRGVGVEFDTLDPEARERVNSVVQALRAQA
jgi:type IV pilus assembly protein PilZ